MQLELVSDKTVWENLVMQYPEANFLQSWQWGSFQEKLGKKVLRLYRNENGQSALAQVVIEAAKRGTYAAIAGGPLIAWQSDELVIQFFDELKKYAKQESCSFIRFRPQVVETAVSATLLSKITATVSPMHLTADLTLQLDITKTEEELLAQMRKNTRYEVRKAEKEGIVIKISQDTVKIAEFYTHQMALAQKHNFVPFSKQFLEEQFSAFASDNQVALIESYKDDQLLAAAFVIFYNGEAVYHYGISTPANGHLPGAYAVQWAAIKEAKQRGCTRYNFWGVAPEGNTSHRFAGVSLFKRGFGGDEVAYLPAHDIPLSAGYGMTWIFETVRKKMRRL